MAQRRTRRFHVRAIARRCGLAVGRGPVTALVALACVAGGGGVVHQLSDTGTLVERGSESMQQDGREDNAVDEGSPEKTATETESEESQGEQPRCIVHVDGAVGAPGVVELTGTDLRVYDAVKAAGNLLEDADTTTVNLAEPLSDGAKIHIPHVGEQADETQAAPMAGQAETVGATGTGGGKVLVNLNTATAEELQTLNGVGEATARAIIEDREQNGPFATPEDLMRVSGIGEKKFAKIRSDVCV